jgi:YVTN family beta-propeller protein
MMKRYISVLCVVFVSMLVCDRAEALMSQSCSNPLTSQQPTGLAIDNIHNAVWVALFQAGGVVEISLSDCLTIRSVSTGLNPEGVAFDGVHVWVANLGSNSVTEIDASTGAVIATIPVGSQPRGLTYDGTYVWVANYGSNTVSRLSSPVLTFTVGSGPYFLAYNSADNNIYVPNRNSNTVTVLSKNGVPVRTIATDSQPQFVAQGAGFDMWVSCYSSQKIDRISGGAVVQAVSAPHSGPTGITLDPRGFLYGVTNSGYTYGINLSTGLVFDDTFRGGSNHAHFDAAFFGTFLWVTDFGGGAAVKLIP